MAKETRKGNEVSMRPTPCGQVIPATSLSKHLSTCPTNVCAKLGVEKKLRKE